MIPPWWVTLVIAGGIIGAGLAVRRLRRDRRDLRPVVPGRPADAGEAWCGSESPCHSVAQEPVEPAIAAMSAKARLIPGRLLPAANIAPSTRGVRRPQLTTEHAHSGPPVGRPVFVCSDESLG